MRYLLIVSATVLAALAACTSAPPPAAPPPQQPTVNAATQAAATKAHLASEKARLAALFRGTPVVFSLQPDGSMRVDVPLQYSFDAGRAAVKPPLAAVLDRIVTGQRNELTRVAVSAPGDAAAPSPALGNERSASLRDYCIAHGFPADRVSVAPNRAEASVRILVTDMALP